MCILCEDIEGSIRFERTVAVNPSPVPAQAGGRRSDLMIQVCSCNRRFLSLRNPNNTDILMTCKGCGGDSIVDRGGLSCGSKANTRDLELPRPIDPELRWKTVNKRQRAARRARTSFSGEDRMKDEIKSFYACPNATSREVAQDNAPVSESEKFGVSILGRRFSDPLENVPIKKRRVHMDCSPSPPPTPLLVDPYEKKLSRSCGGISSYGKHRKVKTLGGKHMKEKRGPLDAADFSGISILAAAACESEMDVAMLNGECLKSAHSLEERKPGPTSGSSELALLHEIKGDELNIPDASYCKLDRAKKFNEIAPDKEPLFPTTWNSSESAPDMNPLFRTTLKSSENCVESAAALEGNTSLFLLSNANKTNDFSSVCDAKSSDVTISTNSSTYKPAGCFRDTVEHTKHSNAARDSRLHWDLNVAMEVWDIHRGDGHDMVGPDPVASISDCNDAEKEMNKEQACDDLSESTVAVNILHHSGDKVHVVGVTKDVRTRGEGDFLGDPFHPLCSRSPQNMQLLESESLNGNDSSAETNDLPDRQKRNYVSEVKLHLGSDPDLSSLALTIEHFSFAANVEKLDVSHTSRPDRDGLSRLASEDGHGGRSSTPTSDLGFRVKPMTSRLVSEESTNIATVTVSNKSCTDIGWIDDKLGQTSLRSISEFKNQELLDVDSGTSKIYQSVDDEAEHAADVSCVAKRAANADTDSELPDSHPENNPCTSDCVMSYVHEEGGVVATINHKNRLITCANSSSAETYYIASDTHARGLNSECTKQAATDMDSIVDSQSAVQSYPSGYKNDLQKVATNSCLEQYQTGTSHISKDHSVTGKVDVEEDDSQYEDGELRESGDRYWVDDGYEEVKYANIQVSDYKDEKAAPDIHFVRVGAVSNNRVTAVADYNGSQSRKEDRDVSPVSSKRSWSSNCVDGGSGLMCSATTDIVHVRNETQMYDNSDRVMAGSAATVSQSERGSDGVGDDPLNNSTKLTGWDMLPDDQRYSRHDSRDRVDSSNQCVLGILEAVEAGESFQQMGLSIRDMQSRLGRPRSFDRPLRNEQCRSDDGYGSGSKAERTIDRSHGRGGASRHIQASNRGEQWVENSNNSRSTQRRSPDYYNYGPPGPRNAAEAAVAKMESNGFVVAPDGTLVRAVDAANAGTMARRMRNTSGSYHPLTGRGSPVDKDGSCGLSRAPAHAREAPPERRFGASGNQSGRYGPEMDKEYGNDGNLSSVRCSLSNKQQRFPPHRASLNLSCAQSSSPSGSRSRSPHTWTSPRDRREIMANGGSSIQIHSRSRNYITAVRIGRMTSPRRQPGFNYRVMRDSPSSRNRTYSRHDSTWVEGRSCSTVNYSDHKKRCSRRSPPPRITSRDDRFDVMDSQGQPRSREFHRTTQERLPCGFERGNKHGGNGDDKREYNDRYGTVKPYEQNGVVKQFRNHTGDKTHPHISAPRSPEPQRRGSPQRF
ncbi:unnamed protein product [Alopecurus aequalis]